MNTREHIEPTLRSSSSSASAEYHVSDQLTVIDWSAALPRRPHDYRPKTQPVARAGAPLWLGQRVDQADAEATPAPRARKHISTGRGIVWAAAIVTLAPIAVGLVVLLVILTMLAK